MHSQRRRWERKNTIFSKNGISCTPNDDIITQFLVDSHLGKKKPLVERHGAFSLWAFDCYFAVASSMKFQWTVPVEEFSLGIKQIIAF